MSTSSQGTMDILAGESQLVEDPTPEDFWGALIESIVPNKDKGK